MSIHGDRLPSPTLPTHLILVKLILKVFVVHLVCSCLAGKVENRVGDDAVLEVLADLVVQFESLVESG